MKAGHISQIALAVKDLEASIVFYRDTLGFPLLFTAPPEMAFFDIHGIRLMLSQAQEAPTGGPILYFSVDAIDTAYQELEAQGANCIRKPLMTHATEEFQLWLAFITDPDGHTLALMEERPL
jgi:predicted enzyme related to lactoylglutathione lyase